MSSHTTRKNLGEISLLLYKPATDWLSLPSNQVHGLSCLFQLLFDIVDLFSPIKWRIVVCNNFQLSLIFNEIERVVRLLVRVKFSCVTLEVRLKALLEQVKSQTGVGQGCTNPFWNYYLLRLWQLQTFCRRLRPSGVALNFYTPWISPGIFLQVTRTGWSNTRKIMTDCHNSSKTC